MVGSIDWRATGKVIIIDPGHGKDRWEGKMKVVLNEKDIIGCLSLNEKLMAGCQHTPEDDTTIISMMTS